MNTISMNKRKFKNFTIEELKIIEENTGKISLRELSDKLKWNYTNLSGAINQHKVDFKPFHARPKIERESSSLEKKRNKKNELLLTDAHLREWFKPF